MTTASNRNKLTPAAAARIQARIDARTFKANIAKARKPQLTTEQAELFALAADDIDIIGAFTFEEASALFSACSIKMAAERYRPTPAFQVAARIQSRVELAIESATC